MAAFLRFRNRKNYRDRVNCDGERYKELYRFSEENVEWMADHFLGEYDETRGKALSSKQKMKIFLRFLGDPGFQTGIAEDIGVHRSTVTKTIPYVLGKVVEKSTEWVVFPTHRKVEEEKTEWLQRFNFPSAFGAIDCTHIPIMKPTQYGDDYVNRKGFCSINVQATCNSKEIFTSIDAQWPGSVHDSRVLSNSSIFQLLNNTPANAVILGDSGYALSPWLMTPYNNARTPEEIAYNRLHAKERVIIERCFGQLKKRFPILQHPIRVALEKVPSIIVSCVILHNIAKYLQDDLPWDETEHENDNENGNENLPEEEIGDAARRRLGQRKRDEIKTIISNL